MYLAELRDLIARHAADPVITVPGLQLASVTTPMPPRSSIATPTLAVIAQGSKRIVFNDRVFDYGAGDFLVVTLDLPVTGHFVDPSTEHPCLGIGLDLRPELIASLLLRSSTEGVLAPTSSRELAPPIAVSRATDKLLDAVVRLLRLLDHPTDVSVLAPLIEREIAWRLITSEQGAVVRQIGVMDSSFSRIGRVIRGIRERPAEPFLVEQLADEANMSLSTFHRHFRSMTSMSPIQFQKKVRLQQARLLLLGAGQDVAGAAFASGYDSPSQFIREYRREFGAPPGRDAANLRANQPAPARSALP